jgi:methionine synthase I (cobalamin-dependent)
LAARLSERKILLVDGAMGTQLELRGKSGGGEVSLTAPEVVLDVHRDYLSAGSQAIITNTLTMNRVYLETHGSNTSVDEVNRKAGEIAREAAGDDRFVLGNLGSTGQMLEPYGTFSPDQFEETYREQASALAGVDGFLIETMFDLNETLCAVRACKAVSSIPILVSMTFTTTANGGRTMMGNSAADCAGSLTDAGASVVGTNCGDLSPLEMAQIVRSMRESTDLPILVEPNAGKPKLVEDRTVYDMPPAVFADGIGACIEAGATVIGGCCGTSPDHIRVLADRFAGD